MSTLHKVKAYFGMAPLDDYEDEYYEDEDRPARGYSRRPREDRFEEADYPERPGRRYDRDRDYGGRDYDRDDGERDYDERDYDEPYRGGYREDDRFEPRPRPREFTPPSRLSALRGSTRGALAMDPRRMAELFDASSPLSKITTLRPKDYSEARTIGERFRDGTPVIMDLVSMDNADAKRLVDFAAGLAFALRGSFDKVATKVFLLSPADVDVTAEERRRIAEAGFYN
nr:MAG: cell division protein SepF [Mycolicibacterium hassiacum]